MIYEIYIYLICVAIKTKTTNHRLKYKEKKNLQKIEQGNATAWKNIKNNKKQISLIFT